MLSHQSASQWFSRILENDKSGNCEQKILGLRRIFDNVLLEMFPNISEQAFYHAAIEKIFDSQAISKCGYKASRRLKREFHSLRMYLNSVQHSQIVADMGGYMRSLRRLAVLISFCATIEIPKEILNLVGKDVSNVINVNTNSIPKQKKLTSNSHSADSAVCRNSFPSVILIIDRGSIKSLDVVLTLEHGIESLCNNIFDKVNKVIIISLNRSEIILSNPISKTKHRFTFTDEETALQLKPLKDFITNSKISRFVSFFLSDVNVISNFEIPAFLSQSEYSLNIGIVGKDTDLNIAHKRNFDKLVKPENLMKFFNWVAVSIVNF